MHPVGLKLLTLGGGGRGGGERKEGGRERGGSYWFQFTTCCCSTRIHLLPDPSAKCKFLFVCVERQMTAEQVTRWNKQLLGGMREKEREGRKNNEEEWILSQSKLCFLSWSCFIQKYACMLAFLSTCKDDSLSCLNLQFTSDLNLVPIVDMVYKLVNTILF